MENAGFTKRDLEKIISDLIANDKITRAQYDRLAIDIIELRRIVRSNTKRAKHLQPAGSLVANVLLGCPKVHSAGFRLKDKHSVVRKVIEYCHQRGESYIDSTNYASCIYDLVGARALFLFNEEWPSIHRFILDNWTQKEPPVAIVRTGDLRTYEEMFRAEGCRIETRATGYKAVHYYVDQPVGKEPITVEIQARSIFEEARSEVDHKVNYRVNRDPSHDIYTLIRRLSQETSISEVIASQLFIMRKLELIERAERARGRLDRNTARQKRVALRELEIVSEYLRDMEGR